MAAEASYNTILETTSETPIEESESEEPGINPDKSDIGVEDEHLTALSLYGKISGYRDFVTLYKEISSWFFCSFSSEEQSSYYYDGGAPGGHKHLNSAGSNVGNVLEYIRMNDEEEYERIVTEI